MIDENEFMNTDKLSLDRAKIGQEKTPKLILDKDIINERNLIDFYQSFDINLMMIE